MQLDVSAHPTVQITIVEGRARNGWPGRMSGQRKRTAAIGPSYLQLGYQPAPKHGRQR